MNGRDGAGRGGREASASRRPSKAGARRRREEADAPRSLGGSLDEYLASEGLLDVKTFADIVACWMEAVGADVAAHAHPKSLKGTELVVAVDHSSWATQLAFLSGAICDRLADQLGWRAVEHLKGYVDPRSRLD
jgi:predicted nucleic acid-binding Zn ribbon protein